MSTDASDLWETFKDGVLKVCDEVYGKKKSRRDQGDMWWWNEEIKDTMTRKKAAFKELCRFPSEENKNQYKQKVNTRKTKLMVSGSEGELYKNKIDPCGVCVRRVMVNSVLCTKCENWVHGKCAKIKRASARLAMHFVCLKCKGIMEGTMDSIKKLCNEVETVNGFCYLGDRLNASGGCEAAVTARVGIGWVRFRKCGELLLGNRFPLKTKGKLYRCCVRSAILYGSETWCLKENDKAILRRTERAMVGAMCGQKVVDRKTTEEQMDLLGLKETIDQLATANGVRWYGHVLRRDDNSVLRAALNLEVTGKRKQGQSKKTWKKQVEEETEKVGLKKEDALRRDKWRDGV